MESPWLNRCFATDSLKNIDLKFNPKTQQQVSFLIQKMKLNAGDQLLDLGCGAGRHSIEFAKRNIKVIGIDISPYMLEQAEIRSQKENAKITFLQADLNEISSLGLVKGSFSGAVCLCESGIGVLGSENKDIDFFRSVYSLIKSKSYFVFSCFNSLRRYIRSKDQNPKFDYINSVMSWQGEINGQLLTEKDRQYSPSEIKLMLSICGFQDIDILSCNNGVFSDDRMGIEDIEMLVTAQKP